MKKRAPRGRRSYKPFVCLSILVFLLVGRIGRAQDLPFEFKNITLPPGFISEPIIQNLSQPVDFRFVDSEGKEALVLEKAGRVQFVRNGTIENTVLDLTNETLDSGDRGLLGLALDPEFQTNGYFYLFVVVDPDLDGNDDDPSAFGRLLRYTAERARDGRLVTLRTSRRVLLGQNWSDGIPCCLSAHALGSLEFLPDGSLLCSTGDSSSFAVVDTGGHAPKCFGPSRIPSDQDTGAFRASSLDSYSGKILRVDPATGLGLPDNPFFSGDPHDVRSRIFCLGLRNPFRIAYNRRLGQSAVYIADVGWRTWEEINVAQGGENFGWPCFEGREENQAYRDQDVSQWCDNTEGTHTDPLLAYHHTEERDLGFVGHCIGGLAFYDGVKYPPIYRGALFFSDWASSWIRAARLDEKGQIESVMSFGTRLKRPFTLRTHPANGDIVYVTDEEIRRLRYTGRNRRPLASITASQTFGDSPLTVQFSAEGSQAREGGNLTFHWDFGDGTEAEGISVEHVFATSTASRVVLTVTDAEGRSRTDELLITPDNRPPLVTPSVIETGYTPGESVILTGNVTDAEDLAEGRPTATRWTLSLVRGRAVQEDFLVFPGSTATFTPEHYGNDAYLIANLEATDSHGLTTRVSRSIFDVTVEPVPRLESFSDFRPRSGQTVQLDAAVSRPGRRDLRLEVDWGDGEIEAFSGLAHDEIISTRHVYESPGEHALSLRTGDISDRSDQNYQIVVRNSKPAIAVFAPLAAESEILWNEQIEIAQTLVDELRPLGTEVAVFSFNEQERLVNWLKTYLRDDQPDALILIDASPASVFAGEDNSLAERWIEGGNGILWTGREPFTLWIDERGISTVSSDPEADKVLNPKRSGICRGAGSQVVDATVEGTPTALKAFQSDWAVRYDQRGPEWDARWIFAKDRDRDSDAILMVRQGGGFYAQFYCVNRRTHPLPETNSGKSRRAAVLSEFLGSQLARRKIVTGTSSK